MAPEKLLIWLLRIGGIFLILAWPTVIMPTSWQAAGHEMLGLGPFPASPLMDYLTRTIAVLYGTRGMVYWLLASDIRRFEPLIKFFAVMDIVAGICFLGIGIHATLPAFWWAFEGPSLVGFGAIILWLLKKLPADT